MNKIDVLGKTTDKYLIISHVLDNVESVIDHLNVAHDLARDNDMDTEANELMIIKAEVWTLRQKLEQQYRAQVPHAK
jgi:7-cyano-7-deazaguanine synthase in queuosine biosynthesis